MTEQTLAQQAFLHAQVHDTVASDDRYAGLLGWVAFDYASQNGFTYKAMKKNGVADIFRVAKPGAASIDPRSIRGAGRCSSPHSSGTCPGTAARR